MSFDKTDCLTVADFLHALSKSSVSVDMPVGICKDANGFIDKAINILLVDGVIVIDISSQKRSLNDEEHSFTEWENVAIDLLGY